jgi:hypothetical protein
MDDDAKPAAEERGRVTLEEDAKPKPARHADEKKK